MEGERQFYLYILSLSTVVCIVSLIFELCQNGKTLNGPNNKISYTRTQLLDLKSRAHTTRISTEICRHITNLQIKRSFGRKRGGKRLRHRTWDQNRGIHHNLLQPMEQSDNFKNPSTLNMALVNIQSLKPKLDMLIHHMQVSNMDMVFVTETWTEDGNESEHQYIKANINTAGYHMLIQSRENWRGGGIAIIYKSHLQVKKLIFNNYTSFESLTIILNISSKLYLFLTIYRAPYSTK